MIVALAVLNLIKKIQEYCGGVCSMINVNVREKGRSTASRPLARSTGISPRRRRSPLFGSLRRPMAPQRRAGNRRPRISSRLWRTKDETGISVWRISSEEPVERLVGVESQIFEKTPMIALCVGLNRIIRDIFQLSGFGLPTSFPLPKEALAEASGVWIHSGARLGPSAATPAKLIIWDRGLLRFSAWCFLHRRRWSGRS